MSDIKNDTPVTVENLQEFDQIKPTTTIDTVHKDEAVKVLETYDGDVTWADAEEKKLRRKIDWRLLPVLCMTYGLQYYDKAMLSQAALFGLRTELDLLQGNRYSFTAAIFYLGFIVGAYPAMFLAQRYPIERVASAIVTVWGICLILTTSCKTYQGIYAQRFFLGFLESGISPMFMVIVGSFYKKNEQAMRMGIWYSCTGYVSCISPLVNYGLGQINGGVNSWRYMYYFSGALTVAWGIALYFLLPPDPIRAKGFDERERFIMVARVRSNNSGVRNTHFKGAQVLELLCDSKFWLMFSIAFLSIIANGAISTFVPIIIHDFGFSTVNSLLLVIPAGAYAGTVQLLMPYLAYKFVGLRSWIVVVAQLGTVIASLLLWLLPISQKGALLFACYILPSVGGGYAVLMGHQIANTAGYTKRTVSASGLYIGYCFGTEIAPEPPSRALKGKVAIVTGAVCAGDGTGNGRAISIMLADAGCNVVCLDRDTSWAEKTAEIANSIPGRGKAIASVGDVTSATDCEKVIRLALQHFGRLDILVNNVGIAGAAGTATDVDMQDWAKGLEVNVSTMVLMCKYAIPAMLHNEGEIKGSIVNMGSVAGLKGGTPHLLYPTSKGAIVNMTRAMAAHRAKSGIRVNCVCPGMLYTPMMYAKGMTEEARAARRARSLLGTEGNGWDCASAVIFLASNHARWITGAILPVDAGTTAAVGTEMPASASVNAKL